MYLRVSPRSHYCKWVACFHTDSRRGTSWFNEVIKVITTYPQWGGCPHRTNGWSRTKWDNYTIRFPVSASTLACSCQVEFINASGFWFFFSKFCKQSISCQARGKAVFIARIRLIPLGACFEFAKIHFPAKVTLECLPTKLDTNFWK